MNILIVSSNYYPDISPRSSRTTELSREFSRQGHSVRVYISNVQRDYNEEFVKYGVEVKQFPKNRFRRLSTKYVFFNKIIHKVNRVLELLFEYPNIEFYFHTINLLNKDKNQYDLLISISSPYPIHWGVAKQLIKKPDLCKMWIADCGDPYMGATLERYRKPFYFKYIEKWFCKHADYITVPVIGAVDGYYPEFRDKIRVVPQGFRMDSIYLYTGKVSNIVPTFAYAGNIALGVRNPIPIIDYLLTTKKEFKFVFYTKQKDFLLIYKNILGDSIEIHDYIERDQLLFELSKMDFLINLDNGTKRQVPSKLIDYSIAGRPVLNLYVLQLDKDLIDEFLSGNYSNSLLLPDKEIYKIENIAKCFIDLAINNSCSIA